jgi:hypothetical protein
MKQFASILYFSLVIHGIGFGETMDNPTLKRGQSADEAKSTCQMQGLIEAPPLSEGKLNGMTTFGFMLVEDSLYVYIRKDDSTGLVKNLFLMVPGRSAKVFNVNKVSFGADDVLDVSFDLRKQNIVGNGNKSQTPQYEKKNDLPKQGNSFSFPSTSPPK